MRPPQKKFQVHQTNLPCPIVHYLREADSTAIKALTQKYNFVDRPCRRCSKFWSLESFYILRLFQSQIIKSLARDFALFYSAVDREVKFILLSMKTLKVLSFISNLIVLCWGTSECLGKSSYQLPVN